jgi:hypothetical protein
MFTHPRDNPVLIIAVIASSRNSNLHLLSIPSLFSTSMIWGGGGDGSVEGSSEHGDEPSGSINC